MCWKPATDTFHFIINSPAATVITKRSILSTIAKLFDPLGLIAPVIIKAKILIQELWVLKIDWDDSVPQDMHTKWNRFIQSLRKMSNLTFPRWIHYQADCDLQLHGFCDASQHAISAVVYTRSTTQEGKIFTCLLCSKINVAPLKKQTIPRLELTGAVMLTKLIAHILSIFDQKGIPIYMWTDSSISHTWINNHPSRWKEFVYNRVCFIQETLPQAIWKFVPGTENSADCASRDLTPIQLSENTEWWTGPPWLSQDSSTWPDALQLPSKKDNLEEKSSQVLVLTNKKNAEPWELLHKYSSLTRLIRITAWCRRAISKFKRDADLITGPLTTHELEAAKFYWVKVTQQISFHQEIGLISNGKPLPKSNPLLRLTPFMDSNGLLRIKGRLQLLQLPTAAQSPLILPKTSIFTSLVISDAHFRTMHGGTQSTTTFLRNEYWIVGGRAPVRSFILKCVKCARFRQKRAQQIMGQLSMERVTPSRPFLHSGIDYAGPFHLKTWKGKNSRTYKAYIALFICQATSAIHLELVTDYTTDGFIAAYKRFTARRGICATLRSDCGTNLVGADSELRALFSATSKELGNLAAILADDGTQWLFNPPASPHFGGHWEAGVK